VKLATSSDQTKPVSVLPVTDVVPSGTLEIVPFRYSGPAELDYLGDGVFQLLASRFTGDVGPRATDPTATASVWDEASTNSPTTANRDVALRLGAGLVLTGGVVAGPDGLNLSASLRDVSTEEEVATATAQGPPDSLAAVVERLAGGILSLSVGEYEESLTQLTSADPDALREYLLGQVEFRNGRWVTAYDHFVRAVQIDSTFALASIWIADAGNNVSEAATAEGLARAWRHRDRLSDRDRSYLEARLGPNYPEPATREERRRAYEAAARLAPDRANIWYFLGETTVHSPTSVESYEQAFRYFERALELDPRNPNAVMHLQLTHILRRDVAGIIDAADRLAALDTTRLTQLTPRWLRAVTSEDSASALSLSTTRSSQSNLFLTRPR
jgi:tetratricopeptide (TPR) repeat protein